MFFETFLVVLSHQIFIQHKPKNACYSSDWHLEFYQQWACNYRGRMWSFRNEIIEFRMTSEELQLNCWTNYEYSNWDELKTWILSVIQHHVMVTTDAFKTISTFWVPSKSHNFRNYIYSPIFPQSPDFDNFTCWNWVQRCLSSALNRNRILTNS